jgi:phosphoglycolate phosphatase
VIKPSLKSKPVKAESFHPRYSHIIWDWNGTLLDDAWLCVEILNELSEKRGLPAIHLAQYHRDFCFPVLDFYLKLGFNFKNETFDVLSEEYIRLYNARRFECSLQPESLKTVAAFYERGIGQSVLSAYNQVFLSEALQKFNLLKYFPKISGLNNNLAQSKTENGKQQIRELGCSPGEVLLVGDTDHDLHVAQGMGVSCVLLEGGHQSRERLKSHGVPVFNRLDDLYSYVCPLPLDKTA